MMAHPSKGHRITEKLDEKYLCQGVRVCVCVGGGGGGSDQTLVEKPVFRLALLSVDCVFVCVYVSTRYYVVHGCIWCVTVLLKLTCETEFVLASLGFCVLFFFFPSTGALVWSNLSIHRGISVVQ